MTSMKPSEYRTYFQGLTKRHPLTADVPVRLILKDVVHYKDKTPRGLCSVQNGCIVLQVAVRGQHPLLVIKTIAHEYRHAMQWINMSWSSKNPSDPAMESDAQLFGQMEANMIMRGAAYGHC